MFYCQSQIWEKVVKNNNNNNNNNNKTTTTTITTKTNNNNVLKLRLKSTWNQQLDVGGQAIKFDLLRLTDLKWSLLFIAH